MTQTGHAKTSYINMSSSQPSLQPANIPYDERLERGPFPFLALPTEIRLAMYEAMSLTLSFPRRVPERMAEMAPTKEKLKAGLRCRI